MAGLKTKCDTRPTGPVCIQQDSLWDLYELQQELLSIAKFRLVSIKGPQHLQLVHLWQDLEQTPQFLSPDVIMFPISDELNDVLIGAAQTELTMSTECSLEHSFGYSDEVWLHL